MTEGARTTDTACMTEGARMTDTARMTEGARTTDTARMTDAACRKDTGGGEREHGATLRDAATFVRRRAASGRARRAGGGQSPGTLESDRATEPAEPAAHHVRPGARR